VNERACRLHSVDVTVGMLRCLPGDVDILLTHANEEIAQTLLGDLLAILQTTTGLISAVLTSHRDTSGKQQQQGHEGRWSHASMCIVCLPDDAAPPDIERPLRHRRMDLKVCFRCKGVSKVSTRARLTRTRSCMRCPQVYSKVSMPFALLYFTGSDHFNRSMRFWAKQARAPRPLLRRRVWSGKLFSSRTVHSAETMPLRGTRRTSCHCRTRAWCRAWARSRAPPRGRCVPCAAGNTRMHARCTLTARDVHSSHAQYEGGAHFNGRALDAKTEEGIFHALWLEYVPPELRSV
jgi:hypothetical protein